MATLSLSQPKPFMVLVQTQQTNMLLQKSLKQKRTWFIFPFAVSAVLLSGVYFVASAWYMLIDLLVVEMKKELESGNEKAGVLAVAFKYFIAYSIYIYFQLARIMMLIPMAMMYFLISIFFFVSSIGVIKENPFVFHTL